MRHRGRTAVGAAGIVATVLLHSLLLAVAVWGNGRFTLNSRLPDAVGSGANSGKPEGDVGERRIHVMLTPLFETAAPSFEPAPQLLEPQLHKVSMLQITGPDAIPLPPVVELPGEEVEEQEAQMMARARYAGMYESQVRARIERAWELPPAEPVAEPEFSCLVLITQHRDGRVKQVELVAPKCQGPDEWQMSLVNAIQAASPLPAPPHPSAFVDRFSLVFHSSAVRRSSQTASR